MSAVTDEWRYDADRATIFHKWSQDDWSYRVCTWYHLNWLPFSPHSRTTDWARKQAKERPLGPFTLLQTMDHRHNFDGEPSPFWEEW